MLDKLRKSIFEVEESSIRSFNAYARENNAKYFLTLGEPGFETHDSIKEAVKEALDKNMTHYGPTPGNVDLREKIREFEKKLNKVDYDVDEIVITNGSTEAIAMSLLTILEKGDEVIVPLPAYPQYKEVVKFAECRYVTLNTMDNNFDITRKMLDDALTEKSKVIVLTSPNNPTGHVFSDQSLQNVYDFAKANELFVICDDCYNQLIYGERRLGFSKYTDLRDNIIVCQSFSKPYSMTGWRIGYMMGSRDIIRQITKLHQYTVVAQNSFVQAGAIKALDLDISEYLEVYKRRRDYGYKRLKEMGFEVELPEGAFYLFPSIKKYNMKSLEFCQKLVQEKQLALIPGYCFEADDYIRLSYCVDDDVFEKALDLLEEFMKENF